MTHAKTVRACTFALAATLLGVQPSFAENDPKAHSYYIVSAPLTNVLSMITVDTGVDVDFSPDNVPYVTSSSLRGTGAELVEALTRQFNLSKFEFNGRIYLSSADDQQTRIIANEARTSEEIREAIEQSGIDLSQFKVSEIANPNAIVLTAPTKLVGIVEALVASLPVGPAGRKYKEITVMRGI